MTTQHQTATMQQDNKEQQQKKGQSPKNYLYQITSNS